MSERKTEQNDILFGGWRIDKRLGAGSYGVVYSAVDIEGANEDCAIKHIRIPQSDDEYDEWRRMGMSETEISRYYVTLRERLLSEITVMYKLQGAKNIVDYYEHAVKESQNRTVTDIYIRMEKLTPLESYLEQKVIDDAFAVKVGVDICTALEACAKLGIVHRDVKISNIFVSDDGMIKLGDFGIAREIDSSHNAANLSIRGTPLYMAPEIYMHKKYDCLVDIYSLGILLYYLLNDKRHVFFPSAPTPILPRDVDAAFDKRIRGDVAPPPAHGAKPLAAIVLRAISVSPAYRFQSAEEMKNALLALKICSAQPNKARNVLDDSKPYDENFVRSPSTKQHDIDDPPDDDMSFDHNAKSNSMPPTSLIILGAVAGIALLAYIISLII